MADKITTAQTIRQLAVLFEGMVDAANTLEAIGSIENAIAEAIKAKDEAVAERDAVKAEAKKHKDAIKKAKDDFQQIIFEANTKADDIKAAAQAEAVAITQSATDQADVLIAHAQQQHGATLADAHDRLIQLNTQLGVIKSEIANAESARDAANAEAEAAETRLANAKDAIKKLMAE